MKHLLGIACLGLNLGLSLDALASVSGSASASAASAPAPAPTHTESCEAIPQEQWRPQADLVRFLTNKGWKIERVVIANGCYEVYARDAKNAKQEVFFNPKTLEVVTAPARPQP